MRVRDATIQLQICLSSGENGTPALAPHPTHTGRHASHPRGCVGSPVGQMTCAPILGARPPPDGLRLRATCRPIASSDGLSVWL